MAISIEESLAPSMRENASRWPPSSTTAMSMGTPISAERFSAAARTAFAPAKVSLGVLRVTSVMTLSFRASRRPELCGIQQVGRAASLEQREDVFRGHHSHLRARLDRGRGQMRRQNDVRTAQAVGDFRLVLVDVQRGAGDEFVLERGHQRGFARRPARAKC